MFGGPEVEHISATEAAELVSGAASPAGTGSGSSVVLVDVREQWEWDAGHAPQAVHLPMTQLEERHGELDPEATLLIVCHSGQRSLSVTHALARAGYNAINVDGGMLAWHAAGGAFVAADASTDGSEEPRV